MNLIVSSKRELIQAFICDGMTLKEARKIPLKHLIENNTRITSLTIKYNLNDDLQVISSGLSNNTTLTRLCIIDKHFHTNRQNIITMTNILDLELEVYRLDQFTLIFMNNTNLNKLCIKTNYICNIGSLIENHKNLKELIIDNVNHVYHNDAHHIFNLIFDALFKNASITKLTYFNVECPMFQINTTLKSLHIKSLFIRPDFSMTLKNNTTLEELVDYNYTRNFISIYDDLYDNKSIISIGNNDPTVRIDYWLRGNKSYRWKSQHSRITDIYIGLVSKSLIIPPYIILEIFDWLYLDNPFTSHLKKITLIMSLQNSVKKIWKIGEN